MPELHPCMRPPAVVESFFHAEGKHMRLLHERPTISLLQPVVRAIQYLVQTWCCHFEFRSPFVALDYPGRFR